MLYDDLIEKLFQVNLHGGVKLGLQNCRQLQEWLDFPDRAFPVIHVAGTNGKGSVVTKIAKGLEEAGLKVGLYTSPHLSCFRERIRINGKMIEEKAVEVILADLFQLIEQENIPATFFELTTFLAFQYFAHEKIDVAVLETGLGGRLDATNIVNPLLTVITSISLDHTDILGTTIEAITREKAGIMKLHVPILIGPRVPKNIIQDYATQLNCSFNQVEETSATYEEENRSIAKMALEWIAPQFSLKATHIAKGLDASQPCRFEIVERSCVIILDVAHNPDGLSQLFQAFKHRFPNRSIRLLFGLSKSKDIQECLKIIVKNGENFHLVEAPNGRGASVSILAEGLQQLGVLPSHILIDEDIPSSLQKAVELATDQNQILVVCGSFFIMSSIRHALGILEPHDVTDMNEQGSKWYSHA